MPVKINQPSPLIPKPVSGATPAAGTPATTSAPSAKGAAASDQAAPAANAGAPALHTLAEKNAIAAATGGDVLARKTLSSTPVAGNHLAMQLAARGVGQKAVRLEKLYERFLQRAGSGTGLTSADYAELAALVVPHRKALEAGGVDVGAILAASGKGHGLAQADLDGLLAQLHAVSLAGSLLQAKNVATALPLDELSRINTRGAVGAVFQLDADKLSAQRMNLKRIVDPERGEGYELTFSLRNEADIRALKDALTKLGAKESRYQLFPSEVDDEGRVVRKKGGGVFDAAKRGTLSSEHVVNLEGKALVLAGEHYAVDALGTDVPYSSYGMTRLTVYGADDAEVAARLGELLDKTGLADALAPSDPASRLKATVARLMWQSAPAKVDELGSGGAELKLSRSVEMLTASGIEPAALKHAELKEVFPGYVTTVLPAAAEKYKELGAQYVFAGVGTLEGTLGILASGGIMSSQERLARGIIVAGASTWQDFKTGGAANVFTRMVTDDAAGVKLKSAPFAGDYQVAFKPEVLGRTDWFAYNSDRYGNMKDDNLFGARKYGAALLESLRANGRFATSNEVMFRTGLSTDDLQAVYTQSEDKRQKLLDALKERGIVDIGGRPIEDVVVVREYMVELSAERATRLIQGHLDDSGLAFSPELATWASEAFASREGLDALSANVSNVGYRGIASVLETVATASKVELPKLRYDEAALRRRLEAALTEVDLQAGDDIQAFVHAFDVDKVPPATLKQTLSNLKWDDPAAKLAALAKKLGTPPPKLTASLAKIVGELPATFEQGWIDKEQQGVLVAYLEKAAAAGVSPKEIRGALQNLAWGQTNAFETIEKKAGKAPSLAIDKKQFDEAVTTVLESRAIARTAELSQLLDAIAARLPVAEARAFTRNLGDLKSLPKHLEAHAKKLGVPAPKLAPEWGKLDEQLGSAISAGGLAYTPALRQLMRDLVAQEGEWRTLLDVTNDLRFHSLPDSLKKAGLLKSGVALPPLTAEPAAVRELEEALRQRYVEVTPAVSTFLSALLEGGVSIQTASSVVQALGDDAQVTSLLKWSGTATAALSLPVVGPDLPLIASSAAKMAAHAGFVWDPKMGDAILALAKQGADPLQLMGSIGHCKDGDVAAMLKRYGIDAGGVTVPRLAFDVPRAHLAIEEKLKSYSKSYTTEARQFTEKMLAGGAALEALTKYFAYRCSSYSHEQAASYAQLELPAGGKAPAV